MSDKDSSKVTFGLEMQHFMMADICLWAGFHKVGCGPVPLPDGCCLYTTPCEIRTE